MTKKQTLNKFFIFFLTLLFLSCKNEPSPIKKESIALETDRNAINIDSTFLIPYKSKILKDFYKSTGFKTVWQSKEKRGLILKKLSESDKEGLNPIDYNITQLKKYEKKIPTLKDIEIEKYDILLTHSFQKYILHLTNGRLNPRKLYNDWDLKENKININQTLAKLIKSDSLSQKTELLKPNNIAYTKLKEALKIIDKLPNTSFTPLDLKNKIILNDTNVSIIDIKKRLIYWKDLQTKDSLTSIYDQATYEAVKKFQLRHGLTSDGVIGKGTLESLNFTKKQRKEQILANLERWKWFPKDLGKEYIIVNIPDYKLTVVKNGKTVRTHRVIVGKKQRKTPVLSSKLSYAVFNPTWTVPPTILKEDVIPSVVNNKGYLAKKNIKVYDRAGKIVPAEDWQLEKAKTYRYVQSPGTFNSLGMVKLLFPNSFSVYLHDTNHRDSFVKNMRSLSSGCVRVENPLELTEYLLNDPTNWNLDKITKTLHTEKTTQVKIKENVMVHLLYWTAWSDKNKLCFRDDIYQLDANLYSKIKKLN